MESILWVAVGGGAGSAARYLVSVWSADRWGAGFPFGTLLVNVIGCYLIGLFMVLAMERLVLPVQCRLFVASGFLGGLTTFSSLSYETLCLAQEGAWAAAAANLSANLATGLLATWLGIVTARLL